MPLPLSRATNIASISDFLPAKMDRDFVAWAGKGLTTVNQLFEGTMLKAFSQLQAQYGNVPNELFKYFQVCHYLMT